MHVYLIGFMGAGKSHDGRLLARALQIPFIDLDDRLEATAGKSITHVFTEDGEAAFRHLEAYALRTLAGAPPAVVATGGGAPCFHGNMDWMNGHGTTVFLDPSVPVLTARLAAGRAHRPLLQAADQLEDFVARKLAERRPWYERAQIHFSPTDENTDAVRFITQHLAPTTG